MPSEMVLISALYDGCGKVYFQFFFFFLSKRNIMTSTCPPLPLQHILREVHVFTENKFKASLPVAPARSSQSAPGACEAGNTTEQGRYLDVFVSPRRL